ncbi:DUF2515 family protein [Massilia haematophila]|uniref:DUF2515 family protein n=1 Tax=Massilia haematophila TaxID=457923 RepID=A0ABV7PJY6_9BURK
MPTTYVPGKPNPDFPRHKYHGIAVGQNLKPVKDCRVHHYVGPAATVEMGIASYQLSAEHLWLTFQREAEDIVKLDGAFIADGTERNRRINAAYAKLWLADNRFQWAGLAAFASKQVGCGLLHARQLAEKSRDELRAVVHWAAGSTDAAGMSAMPATIRNSADDMAERLGFGNLHLFLDIYPLHRFYMERGPKEFDRYLANRQAIARKVRWDVGSQLKFGFPFGQIRTGFAQIEQGNLARSVEFLARHEQVNVLQVIMYNDPRMQDALANNQLAWAIGFPSGVYMEVQLTLAAQCKAKEGWTSYFPRFKDAKLWLADERMKFVLKAAKRFDELLRSRELPYVEESLRKIAAGGGIG